MNQYSFTATPHLFENMREKILSVTNSGDVLIVIPPFYNIGFIALGPYLLQAIAKQQGYKVDVLHLDLLLANIIGTEDYIA